MPNLYPYPFADLCLGDNHHESTLDTCETITLVTDLLDLHYPFVSHAHRWLILVNRLLCLDVLAL